MHIVSSLSHRAARTLTLAVALTLPALSVAARPPVAAPNPVAGAQQCAAATGCEAKFCRIQADLDHAQAAGNTRRADGLRTALKQARASCTPESLQADYARDVSEKESEVGAREADLREARSDGRARKIEKAEKKLREAQQELMQARAAKP